MANFSVSSGINEPYSSNGLGASASGSVWQGAQSIQGNYTDVGWSISAWLNENDGYTWGGNTRGDIGTCRMIINGSVVGSFGMALNNGAGPGTGLGSSSGSTRIYHNSDGTKSISAYIDFVQGGSDMHVSSTASGSQTITLSTIPRASVPTVSKSVADAGSQITVYTNKKASFTHTITYSIGSASGTIGTGVVDSVNWTIPKELLKQFTTTATCSCTISCTTYNGSTKIGDTKTCTLNISVPTDAYPSASISSIVENNTYVKNKNASITVQTISDKTVNVTASGQYGATIKSITVANGASTGKLTASGSVRMTGLSSGTYTMSVTDSRGVTKTVTSTQTYYSYRAPQITQATCARTTQTGSNGTLTVAGAYSNILSNVVSISIKRSDQSAVSITPTYSGTNWSSSKAYTDLAYTNAYSWTITVGDSFGQSAVTTFTLSASQPIWFLGKTLARLAGKLFCQNVSNSGNVTTGSLTVDGKSLLDRTYPVGSIYMSTVSTNPKDLFGGTWQALGGRFLIGADDTYKAGATAGEATHKLTIAEMPSHAHPNTIRVNWYNDSRENSPMFNGWGNSNLQLDRMTINTGFVGENNAHNNMPPYLSVYMWKRTS
nr:MAG TPA: baseplate protein [Caudoviricetes sp.]